MTVHVVTGSWHALSDAAGAIRFEVFVDEQRVPPEMELDEMDAVSLHALALDGDRPVGTGRLLPDGHIGRMAVRREARGHGIGSLILNTLLAAAKARGDASVLLHAQLHARPFYERHGFAVEGDVFMEAGIAHVLMRYRF
ncbi:GNAT family N-acetyltransferase [Noviherbaspirillum pedocola]|uniref:GNAT family N-acetyltransferase n=1 Tax=Noviherbaspirillum pedocola TaxID=2801341 RepID=A0A934W7L2_9BURK|nr:GNAT family N-acetyltransferase [Noviherbaspirillum pedocola]MBK4735718.1 GNAT family N-acetyltransferase [Noviherbaspirillum pedocola]